MNGVEKKKSNLKCIDNYTSVAICVVVKLDSRIKLFVSFSSSRGSIHL